MVEIVMKFGLNCSFLPFLVWKMSINDNDKYSHDFLNSYKNVVNDVKKCVIFLNRHR